MGKGGDALPREEACRFQAADEEDSTVLGVCNSRGSLRAKSNVTSTVIDIDRPNGSIGGSEGMQIEDRSISAKLG